MEGKETLPSLASESSILDLPSVCDLAEHFLPPHSSENSEELYPSVDVFPSPPTDLNPENSNDLKRNLDVGSVSVGRQGKGKVVESKSGASYTAGESNLSSVVPAASSAEGSEKANVRCYSKAGLCELSEPNDTVLPWMYECDSAEDPSIRESLDGFYKMYCKKQPGRTDPTYEAASRCLSQKISELADRRGTKYVSRCLQMAQLVLNRDGCKIFPNHPASACFSKPAEGELLLENRRTPGLSDDILQFLLKQTQAEHSPDVSHQK